jgi:Na+/glutamate symporter
MNKHIGWGLVCGGIFTALITCIAAFDALEEGGLALLASAIFGLAAGVCIGGLIAANFAMLAMEEKEKKESADKPAAELPAAA